MKEESFELYHKSGIRRTIRLKAYGFAKRGVLRSMDGSDNVPMLLVNQSFLKDRRRRGEKIVALDVAIGLAIDFKAAPTRNKE